MNNEELGSTQAGNPAVTDVSKPLTVRDTLASDRQKVDEQRRLESESLMLGATAESFKRVQDEWTKRFEAAMKIQDDETPQVVVRKPQTIPARDLATVYAVRNGKIRPTDANLPSIISSFTSVMTQGKVQGDTTGRSLMTFAKKTDDEKHTIAEGYDVKTNTWTPKATFDALSSMFDRMEMDAAKVEFFRDEKLRRRGMGLGAGESYDRLSHERQLEICNNISGLTDRTWFVNAVDNLLLGLSGRYSDVKGNEIGDKIFDRILNDVTIPASQRKAVDDFIATGAPLNQEEFAKFLYGKGDEYGFGNGVLYIGGNGVTERERMESLSKAYGTGLNGEFNGGVVVKTPTFDEQVKAVKNDDGTFSLQYANGGRYDKEFAFKRVVMDRFVDEDGYFSAVNAVNALNANPESWCFVDKFCKEYKGNYDAILDYGFNRQSMMSDLFDYYDKNSATQEGRDKAKAVAFSVIGAINAIDKRTGAYSNDGDGAVLDGIGRLSAGAFNTMMSGVFEGAIHPLGTWVKSWTWDKLPWTTSEKDVVADFVGRHKDDDKGESEMFAEQLHKKIIDATCVKYFDDGTVVGGAGEFWASIGMLGNIFNAGSLVTGAGIWKAGDIVNKVLKAHRVAAGTGTAYSAYRVARLSAMNAKRFGKMIANVGQRGAAWRKTEEKRKLIAQTEKEISSLDLNTLNGQIEAGKKYDALLKSFEDLGLDVTRLDKFVDSLSSFIGKIPTAAYMYDEATDRAYAEQMLNTTVFDDGEFSDSERDALENFARGKGLVTAIMMSGAMHFALGNMKRAMKLTDKLGNEASSLDRAFDKICRGESGLFNPITGKAILKPENALLFKAVLNSAISRASRSAYDNAKFVFTMGQANTVIENGRQAWEKKRANPNFKPDAFDWLHGTGDNIWEAGKAGLEAGVPTGIIGGTMEYVKGLSKNTRDAIIDSRAKLAIEEFERADAESDAVDSIAQILLSLEENRGDKKATNRIFSDIKKTAGSKAAAFIAQLDYALHAQRTENSISIRSQLEMMKKQKFTVDGLKASLDAVNFKGADVKEIDGGRLLITIRAGEYAGVKVEKPLNIVVSNEKVKTRDKYGNWSIAWVRERIAKRDSEAFNDIYDSLTDTQKNRVAGTVDEKTGAVIKYPEEINGIFRAAERDGIVDRGVYLSKEAAKRYAYLKETDNLTDGLIVLSDVLRNTSGNKFIDSIESIAEASRKRGVSSVETFIHEYFHAITDLLPLEEKAIKDLKAKYQEVMPNGRIRDWKEGFVDDFINTFRMRDEESRAAFVANLRERGIAKKIVDAIRNFRKGVDPNSDEAMRNAGRVATSVEDFIRDVVKETSGSHEAKKEADKTEEAADRTIRSILGEENLSSVSTAKAFSLKLKKDASIGNVVKYANKFEEEIKNGERDFDYIPDFGRGRKESIARAGLSDGTNLLVGATVIANRQSLYSGADLNSRQEHKFAADARAEITEYAKGKRRWYADIGKSMERIKARLWRNGSEAQCWLVGNRVFKAIDPDTFHGGDPRLILNRIAAHNMIFPESAMKVQGFGMYKGSFRVLVSQALVEPGPNDGTLTQVGMVKFMRERGFTQMKGVNITDFGNPDESVWISKDRNYVIADLEARNVIIGKDGKPHPIDAITNVNTPWFRFANGMIPEKYAPVGQMSYDEMIGNSSYGLQLEANLTKLNDAFGLPSDFDVSMLKGLGIESYSTIGKNGLYKLCFPNEANRVLTESRNRLLEEFLRIASNPIESRADVRKRINFSELNENLEKTGKNRIQITTRSGVKIDAEVLLGGSGYLGAVKRDGMPADANLGDFAHGDTGLRFILTGDSGAKLPYGFVKGVIGGKEYSLGDFFGEFHNIAKAYPQLMKTRVYIEGTQQFSERQAQFSAKHRDTRTMPSFGKDNSNGYVLLNAEGDVVVSRHFYEKDGKPISNQKATARIVNGINESVVRLIQREENWESDVTRNDTIVSMVMQGKKDLNGLGRMLKSESNANKFSLNFRLGDARLMDMIRDIVNERVPKYIKGNRDNGKDVGPEDALKERLMEAVRETLADSARFFASEIEARYLAKTYNLDAESLSLLNIAKRQREIDDALMMIDSNHTSRQEQTRRVLHFWRTNIAKTLDSIMYSRQNAYNGSSFSFAIDRAFSEYFYEAYKARLDANHERSNFSAMNGLGVERDYTGVSKGSGKSANYVVTVESRATETDNLSGRDKIIERAIEIMDGNPAALNTKEAISEISTLLDELFDRRNGKGANKELTPYEKKERLMTLFMDALSEHRKRVEKGKMMADGSFSSGTDAEQKLRIENKKMNAKLARAYARQARERAIRNARGMTVQELDARLGVDCIGQVVGMYDETSNAQIKDAKTLASEMEAHCFKKFVEDHPEYRNQKIDELMKNQIAVQEFGSTVAAFLNLAATKCSFGRTRQKIRSDVARIRHYVSRPSIKAIRSMLVSDIDAINDLRKRTGTKKIIAKLHTEIARQAKGNRPVESEKTMHERKVLPRVQQYWKFVDKALDMPLEVRTNPDGTEAFDKNGKRLTAQTVSERIKEIQDKYHFGEEEWREFREGKGDEGVDKIDESRLLQRDLARLELIALQRYGGLGHKKIGEIADAVEAFAFDMELREQMIRNAIGPRIQQDTADVNTLVGACVEARRREKDGTLKLSERKKGWRSALYFNVPDLFARLKMFFPEDSKAYALCEEFRRDMSLAHVQMEGLIAKNELSFREKIVEVFGSHPEYGGKTFDAIMTKLLTKREAYSEFSRSGWAIPAEGADEVEFTKDGKTRKLKLAVGMDDPRYPNVSKNSTMLSLGELIYIWAARNQEDMRVNNAIYRCDEAYMRKLGETIGAEGRAIAEWMTEQWEIQREALSEICERITGMPVLSPDINYCPLLFIGDPEVGTVTRFSIDMFPSFLTRRQNHDINNLREDRNIFDVYSKRIQESAHYISFADIIDRVRTTFGDAKVRSAYNNLMGETAFKAMYKQMYEALSGGCHEPSGWFGRLRNFTTATTLPLNFPSVIRQLEGIAAYSSVMGIRHWAMSLPHIGRSISYIEKNIDGSKTEFGDVMRDALATIGNPFEARKNEGYSDIIVGLRQAGEATQMDKSFTNNRATRWYSRVGLMPTQYIDSLASMSMAGACFNQKLAEHRARGYTMDEAKKMALADLDYSIQVTQQSSRREFQLDFQNSVVGKALTQFAGPSFVRLGMEIEALHRMMYVESGSVWDKTTAKGKAFRSLVNKIAVLHFICPTALSLLGLGANSIVHKADDDEWCNRAVRDWVIACALGPFSGWFIGGSFLTNMASDLTGETFGVRASNLGSGNSPMLSKLYTLTKKTASIVKDIAPIVKAEDIDGDELAKHLGELLDALFPIERTTKRAVINIIGD